MEMENVQNSKDRKERACLKCNKLFVSISAGNRLCVRCNTDNLKVSKQQGGFGIKSTFGHGEYTE
jgi:hypothetical protein